MQQRRQWSGGSEEKRHEWGGKPLTTVSKSKVEPDFSAVIAFLHKQAEYPHNNKRCLNSVLVSPQHSCNILEASQEMHLRLWQLTSAVKDRWQSPHLT